MRKRPVDRTRLSTGRVRVSGRRFPQPRKGEWCQFAAGALAAEKPAEEVLLGEALADSFDAPDESFEPESLPEEFEEFADEPTVLELLARESVA